MNIESSNFIFVRVGATDTDTFLARPTSTLLSAFIIIIYYLILNASFYHDIRPCIGSSRSTCTYLDGGLPWDVSVAFLIYRFFIRNQSLNGIQLIKQALFKVAYVETDTPGSHPFDKIPPGACNYSTRIYI